MIPERAGLLLRLSKSIESSQRSIDTACSWKTLVQALFDLLLLYRRALARGVNMRWIANKSPSRETIPETIKEIVEDPLFNLRFLNWNPTERFAIYDKKEVYLASYPKHPYLESPALWSNAIPLIELAQNYFDMLWNKAA
jgi:hypothetical protein